MIRPQDRVARVLERDERLVEVFASAAPAFERLRHPAMRKVMARLVTVEQAARMAKIDTALLVERLNRALGETSSEPAPTTTETTPMATLDSEIPPHLAALADSQVVDVDVRDALRRGEEPFGEIMAAKKSLEGDQVLRLRATFEPVPLYHVLGKQGFGHFTEQLAEDDWRVWFYREGSGARDQGAGTAVLTPDPRPLTPSDEDGVVVLDVRGMEPPEPMVQTLEALESLPEGGTLVQLNVRVPQFLLPRLEEGGYSYEVREQGPDLVRVFIRRR